MDWYTYSKENELIRHRSIFPVKKVCDFYSEKMGFLLVMPAQVL